ncbi:MAG: putative ATP-dependent endonuclease of OLD family [Alphaproteobacteria bacterium]|jgi:predicted ATP-dependent endonuclease of OLD family
MWFFSRLPKTATVILDEPDVYLHADMQRKLVRIIEDRFVQSVISTHSIEIMSEADPESILVLDKQKSKSSFATSLPVVQSVVEDIGGSQNIQLTRLWMARKCIFVEGEDMTYLNVLHSLLFPTSDPLATSPCIQLEGRSNWPHAVGAAIGLKEAGGANIRAYCLLDRDYKPQKEVENIERRCREHHVDIKIWSRKEIGNYLVIPTAIERLIRHRAREGKSPSLNTIQRRIDRICEDLKDETQDVIADEELLARKSKGLPAANRRARKRIRDAWESPEGKYSVVSGKQIFSDLSSWSKENYGISFSVLSIARVIRLEELPDELVDVLRKIQANEAFE